MKAASFQEMVPMLICNDTQATLAFYCDVLGFSVVGRMDDVGRSGWASLELGRIRLMLASPSYIETPQPRNGRLSEALYYFYVDDVVALRDSVMAKGVEATDLAVRFYGMKEFEITDPEGHVLIFGQDTDEPPTPE